MEKERKSADGFPRAAAVPEKLPIYIICLEVSIMPLSGLVFLSVSRWAALRYGREA